MPFPVQAEEESGVYTVKGGQTGTGKVKAGSDGAVVIKGLKMGDYRVTETKAPEGYNKLTESFLVSAEKIRRQGRTPAHILMKRKCYRKRD